MGLKHCGEPAARHADERGLRQLLAFLPLWKSA